MTSFTSAMDITALDLQDGGGSLLFDCEVLLGQAYDTKTCNLALSDPGYYSCSSLSPTSSVESCFSSPAGPGFSPAGPCFSPAGPGFSAAGPGFSPAGPGFSPAGPGFSPAGPGFSPAGPGFSPAGPGFSPVGPGFSPAGPGFSPAGPGFSPAGPGFSPASLQCGPGLDFSPVPLCGEQDAPLCFLHRVAATTTAAVKEETTQTLRLPVEVTSSTSSTSAPRRVRSRYPGKKRQSASDREKLRMRDLTKALHHLRTYLPPSVAPAGQTLTKIEILRLTIRYISSLSDQLELQEQEAQNPQNQTVYGAQSLLYNPHETVSPALYNPHETVSPALYNPHETVSPALYSPHETVSPALYNPHETLYPDLYSPHETVSPALYNPHETVSPALYSPHETLYPSIYSTAQSCYDAAEQTSSSSHQRSFRPEQFTPQHSHQVHTHPNP
uniref:BHLH domain-containing protein n=1 Tax=Esox lucius TaxID=8010 RepID=A0AAY5KTN1_ESOLU